MRLAAFGRFHYAVIGRGRHRWIRARDVGDGTDGTLAMADKTTVDVLSLEDFHGTLAARLAEAEALLKKLNTELHGRSPAFGTFADATEKSGKYNSMYNDVVERVQRLKSAIIAAQSATSTIITNYKTTEARNEANAAEIASALGGLNAALSGGQTNG